MLGFLHLEIWQEFKWGLPSPLSVRYGTGDQWAPTTLMHWLCTTESNWKALEACPNTNLAQLVPGIYFGLLLTLLRFVMNKLVYEPVARMALDLKPMEYDGVKADCAAVLDAEYNPKSLPTAQVISKLSKTCDMKPAEVVSYMRRKRLNSIRRKKCGKFTEAFFRCSMYTALAVYGIWVNFFPVQPWLTDPKVHLYKDWPHEPSEGVPLHYWLGMGLYWHFLVFQFVDTRRSDFWEMFLHHIITLVLLATSWTLAFSRQGTLIMVIHDVSDIFLELAKLFNYTKGTPRFFWWASPLADGVFAVFALAFFITRLYFYPTFIVLNGITNASQYMDCVNSMWLYFVLLNLLQALHVFWWVLIMKVIYSVVVLKDLKDVRSDDEGEDFPEEEESPANTGEPLASLASNGQGKGAAMNGKLETGTSNSKTKTM